MNERQRFISTSSLGGGNEGMALVLAILVLAAVAVLAIALSTDTTLRVKTSAAHKNRIFAFSYSDLAARIIPRIIEDNIAQSGWNSSDARWDAERGAYRYTPPGKKPYILVYENSFATLENGSRNAVTINAYVDNHQVISENPAGAAINIARRGELAPGAAIQMAAGYEGIGKGAAGGGYHAYYDCECAGRGRNKALAIVEKFHRHVSQ